jgi:Ubiquitin 3 binding protein But2 C-terminal domain
VACQTGGNGWNIYATASLDQTGCVHVTLNVDSCLSGCPPSSPASQSSSPSASASSTPAAPKACPANLSGIYQCPHLITPVSSTNPGKAHGISYNGRVSKSDMRTISNFNLPTSYTGKTCSLVFLFPRQDQLQASSFSISGDGGIGSPSLTRGTNQETTHNNVPGHRTELRCFQSVVWQPIHCSQFRLSCRHDAELFGGFGRDGLPLLPGL